MELTIPLIISILGAIMSVVSLVLNRKDKSNKDTEKESYKWGIIAGGTYGIFHNLEKLIKGE